MSPTQPARPQKKISEEQKRIVLERLKALEQDRKTAQPSDEVFRRILQTPKP